MRNNIITRGAIFLLCAAFIYVGQAYVYEYNNGLALSWPGPTIPIRVQMGPDIFTLTDASVIGAETPDGSTYYMTITSASGAFYSRHRNFGMAVSGPGLPPRRIIYSLTNNTTIVWTATCPV